jgi:hypothetical protein
MPPPPDDQLIERAGATGQDDAVGGSTGAKPTLSNPTFEIALAAGLLVEVM